MKTVRLNRKLNTLILLFFLLLGIFAVFQSAFGQIKKSERPQKFSADPIVDFTIDNDTAMIYFSKNKDLREVVIIDKSEDYVFTVTSLKKFNDTTFIKLSESRRIFFKTKHGVTSILYKAGEGEDYLLVNGAIEATYKNGSFTYGVDGFPYGYWDQVVWKYCKQDVKDIVEKIALDAKQSQMISSLMP